MDNIIVKVIRLGQEVKEYSFASGVQVSEILGKAGVDASGASLRFNGVSVSPTSTLNESGDLLVTKAIQGA